ncbi:hypothetical protein [Pontibacter liquoris]|uniref:hypothetical protein n=1 Tax=Pontibacter liquoris TaxID=2905677 RepID=UPI001FA712A3|nr:hypothetical protein [Pontibacter liquoris]
MNRNYQDRDRAYNQGSDARYSENSRYTSQANQQDRNLASGRNRNENRRESDYNQDYNNDYNRNYNRDYNRDYNSYHLYKRDHDRGPSRSEHTTNFGARAQGDYSGGTRYGEGGSTYGGGSGYGHSYYGPAGDQGWRNSSSDREPSHSVNVQRGYDRYMDADSRNYGSFAGYRQEDFGGSRNQDHDYRSGANTGYNRGNANFNQTGYGATRYNNRDMDRERSASRNRDEDNRNDEYTRSRYRADYRREL